MQAPGGPGADPGWGPGRKQAFGTAPGRRSRVWFTIADGNLSEVFHPSIGQPALRSARFVLAAPGAPPIDDGPEADHAVRWLRPGLPCFEVASRHAEYRLDSRYVTDPDESALLVSGTFAADVPDLQLYMLLVPHGTADGYVLDRDPLALAACTDGGWCVAVGPFSHASAGYLNSSDLFVDLHDNDGAMTAEYPSAERGGVALGARFGLSGGPFQLAIGFGATLREAEETARRALAKGAAQVREDFEVAWSRLSDLDSNVLKVAGDGGQLAVASLAVLRCLEDKEHPGAFIAAPGAPWGIPGQAYTRVWNRDLFHIATALLESGDLPAAARALDYMARTQRPDGSWPQNCSTNGAPEWPGNELDETAFPILLAWRLGIAGALAEDAWNTLVRPAAAYLVANGPATPLDRWEDGGGLSPSTLAVAVAALAAAVEFAGDAGEAAAAEHLQAVADYWNDRVETWTRVPASCHYVRLAAAQELAATPKEPVGIEFTELVRRGLRAAGDPAIEAGLAAADAVLKIALPDGPGWRRYQGDQYGEGDDGSPWSSSTPGRGRSWPLLVGERAHVELMAGRPVDGLIRAIEACAGPELMLPEQVWDATDVPERGLHQGGPSGSATPLGWSHAEYLRLLLALARSNFPDVVEPACRRYMKTPPIEPAFVWSHAHAIDSFEPGRAVRIQLPRPGFVRWTPDGWSTHKEAAARDTTLGTWVADVPSQFVREGSALEWTARYEGEWEGRNYTLTCRGRR